MILRMCLSDNLKVVILGMGFMLIFTAFTTVTLVQQTLIDVIKLERPFIGEGFVSLGITYLTMLTFCWIAPSIVDYFGVLLTMIISSLFFLLYIAIFINLTSVSLYIGAALLGVGASVLWTAQGVYITSISTEETTSKNIGFFWSLFQGSFFFGNLILYLLLQNARFQDIYRTLFTVLTCICGIGICFLTILISPCIRPPPHTLSSNLNQLRHTFRLFFKPNIILISTASLFNGINLAFITGVYPTCVTRTEFFGEYGKTLISLMALAMGAGEIIGGILSSVRRWTKKYGRVSLFFVGYVLNTLCYYTISNMLPARTTSHSSEEITIVMKHYPQYTFLFVILSGFLLGLSDALVSTQIMGIITEHYYKESSAAYAIFKFIQSTGAALAFFTSTYIPLSGLMLSYFISQSVALFSYYFAEIHLLKHRQVIEEELPILN